MTGGSRQRTRKPRFLMPACSLKADEAFGRTHRNQLDAYNVANGDR